jgi:hypothetical protein
MRRSRSLETMQFIFKFIVARAIAAFTRSIVMEPAQRTQVSNAISTTSGSRHNVVCYDCTLATAFDNTAVAITSQT